METIERGAPRADRPSLLFVHGYWQAAWAWDIFVIPALADRGHHCVGLSLRGHGGSGGKIRGSSIGDYVEDVRATVDTFEAPPIVIGHSMGGFVTQHYLAGGSPAAAAVLVSTVPRRGAWGATWKAVSRHPWRFLKTNLTLDVGAVVETPDAAMSFLGSNRIPDDLFASCFARLERASYRAYLDLLFNRPDSRVIRTPSLLIGGSEDAFFSIGEWESTARDLGAPLEILDGAGHQPMWEDEGLGLIDAIDRFASTVV